MGFNNVNVNVSGPVQPTSTYKTKILKGNHSFASQVTEPNTKYVIKYDFDLNGQNVEIPEGCILEFDGGSLSNGTIVGEDTVFINVGDVDIWGDNLTKEGTWKEKQVQSDWNQSDNTQVDYIKNKPDIYTKAEADITFQPKGNYQPAGNYAPASDTQRIVALENAVGSGGSVDTRIAAAKAEIIGDAASGYNTLGKLEDKIQAEASRAQGAESQLSSGKADKATTLVGYGITDAYTKSETYTKAEVNGLVDTPHQEYVTVDAYANLPATGSKDTIYRVSNYNGSTSQVDASVYSEYAWDGSQYVFLCVKSQIGEVFDITAYNSNTKYANLTAALGTNGANVPEGVRKGGMSVKYVNTDNNYVQFRYMSSSTTAADFTNVANWQGVDDEPTAGSDNLVESGGVYDAYSRVFGRSVTFNSNLATSGFTIIAAPADYQKWDLRNKVVLKVTSLSVDSLDDIDWSYFDANGNTVQKHSSDVIDSIEEGTEITLFDEEGAIMRAITFNPSASPIQSPVTISLEVSETESLKHDVELNTEGINALNGDIRNIKGAELKINKTLAPTGPTIILNTTDQGSLYLKDCVKLKVNALGTDHIDSLYYSYVNSQGTVLTRETTSLGRFLSSGDVITLFNTEGCKLRTVVFKASDNHITENTDISISLFEDSIKADTVLNRDDIDNCNKELYGTQFMSLLATSGFTIIMNPSDADTYNIKDIAYLTVDSLFNSDSLAQLDYSYFDKNNNVVQKYLYNIQSGKTYKLFEEGGAKLRAITFNPAVSPILLQTEIRLSVNSKNIAGEVENLKNEVRLIPSFVPEQVLCIKGQNLIIYQNNMFGINDNDTTVSVFVNKPRTNRLGTIFENIQANESVKVTARYNNTDHDYNISLVCKEISQPQGNWFILPIGDSILYSANLSHRGVFNNELSRRFSGVGVPSDSPDFPVLPPSKGWTNIKVIGTMIDDNLAPYPVKYEGRGGWSPYMYMNTQEGNAFYNPNVGHFDLDYYLTENGFYADGVESDGSNLIIPIMLNWNDYKNNLDTFIQRYKALLDNITTSHPAAKVLVLGMNAPSQPIYRTVIFPDGMSSNQEDVKARLIDIENRLEDMVASYVNVYHVPLLPFFTAEDSYPKTTVVYNPRTTNTTELYTDLVHPNYIGNGQMVDIVFNYICCKFFSA